MSLPKITKYRRLWAAFCTFWIPIKKYRKALRGILLIGYRRYKNTKKQDKNKNFLADLAVVAIMKNEGDYLKEWLDFHILVGVQKFYLYDNESTDNTQDVLKPYIERGIVDYIYWPGKAQQMVAYKDAVNKYSDEARWMAFIDLDEFLFSPKYDNLVKYLKTLPWFSALVVSWVIYGSSNQKEKTPGLVIERFKRHADKSWGVKSIFNPRMILDMDNPHTSEVAGFTIDEKGKRLGFIDQTNNPPSANIIRCNHYITKSYEEFMIRCNKGDAAYKNMSESPKAKALELFRVSDHNEVYDRVMDPFIKKLKNGD